MARRKHGSLSITHITKEEFDSEGYYKGYSVFSGRALLYLLEHGRAVFDSINQTKNSPRCRVKCGWRKALEIIKKEYPADYLYIMHKAKDRGGENYLSTICRSYLARLLNEQKNMLRISTASKTFRCASATAAAFWLKRNFDAETEWRSPYYGILLICPNKNSIIDRLNRYGVAEYKNNRCGWVKITRLKNS